MVRSCCSPPLMFPSARLRASPVRPHVRRWHEHSRKNSGGFVAANRSVAKITYCSTQHARESEKSEGWCCFGCDGRGGNVFDVFLSSAVFFFGHFDTLSCLRFFFRSVAVAKRAGRVGRGDGATPPPGTTPIHRSVDFRAKWVSWLPAEMTV